MLNIFQKNFFLQSYSQSSNSGTGSDQEAAPGKKSDYMPVMNETEILDEQQRELTVDQQVEIKFY